MVTQFSFVALCSSLNDKTAGAGEFVAHPATLATPHKVDIGQYWSCPHSNQREFEWGQLQHATGLQHNLVENQIMSLPHQPLLCVMTTSRTTELSSVVDHAHYNIL